MTKIARLIYFKQSIKTYEGSPISKKCGLVLLILQFDISGNMHGMPVSLHLKEIFPSHYDVDDEKLDWFKPR